MRKVRTKFTPNFGQFNLHERSILHEIMFRRDQNHQSFQKIADDLNAQLRFPRHAPRWTWATVRYFYTKERHKNVDPQKTV
jgi:hypothetical protein